MKKLMSVLLTVLMALCVCTINVVAEDGAEVTIATPEPNPGPGPVVVKYNNPKGETVTCEKKDDFEKAIKVFIKSEVFKEITVKWDGVAQEKYGPAEIDKIAKTILGDQTKYSDNIELTCGAVTLYWNSESDHTPGLVQGDYKEIPQPHYEYTYNDKKVEGFESGKDYVLGPGGNKYVKHDKHEDRCYKVTVKYDVTYVPKTTLIEIPSDKANLVYDGFTHNILEALFPISDSNDYATFVFTDDSVTNAKDAGEYKATAHLTDEAKAQGCVWDLGDGKTTTEDQSITWSIASRYIKVTANYSKVYGETEPTVEELDEKAVEFIDGSLADGQTLSLVYDREKGEDADEYDLHISKPKVVDGIGDDVTKNYVIETVDGKFTIEKATQPIVEVLNDKDFWEDYPYALDSWSESIVIAKDGVAEFEIANFDDYEKGTQFEYALYSEDPVADDTYVTIDKSSFKTYVDETGKDVRHYVELSLVPGTNPTEYMIRAKADKNHNHVAQEYNSYIDVYYDGVGEYSINAPKFEQGKGKDVKVTVTWEDELEKNKLGAEEESPYWNACFVSNGNTILTYGKDYTWDINESNDAVKVIGVKFTDEYVNSLTPHTYNIRIHGMYFNTYFAIIDSELIIYDLPCYSNFDTTITVTKPYTPTPKKPIRIVSTGVE